MVGLISYPASAASCFSSRNVRTAARKSARDRIGPTSPLLFKQSHTPFIIFPVLAKWQRVSGLLVQFRQSACKTLQSIRCSTASCDKFHTHGNVEEWF